ncbi:hypothetical protein VNO78_33219 [Psophocarpus tetragonolobus]|uniref:Uncharacterized protein n=1 Tax=Psophocarpus tetragonolobus TaxID=3891 RepID=A0AAN9RPZ5_PSOTE
MPKNCKNAKAIGISSKGIAVPAMSINPLRNGYSENSAQLRASTDHRKRHLLCFGVFSELALKTPIALAFLAINGSNWIILINFQLTTM